MDGFWWFGHTKPSKQCDLLSFHQDVDDDESGETTNDEDLDMDGPIEAANVQETEEALGVTVDDDDTDAVQAHLDESRLRARLEAAGNSEKDLRSLRRSFDGLDGQLLSEVRAKSLLDELKKIIVSRETILSTSICKSVLPYRYHTAMSVRVEVRTILGTWKLIFGQKCLPMSVSEYETKIL